VTDKDRLTVYLPSDLVRTARAAAASDEISLSVFIELALRKHLENHPVARVGMLVSRRPQ